jgi:hypothetical protein
VRRGAVVAVLNGFTTYAEACHNLMAYRVTRLKFPQHRLRIFQSC